MKKKDVIMNIEVGDTVRVLKNGFGDELGTGVVVSVTENHSWIEVRFNGETKTQFWSGSWVWID